MDKVAKKSRQVVSREVLFKMHALWSARIERGEVLHAEPLRVELSKASGIEVGTHTFLGILKQMGISEKVQGEHGAPLGTNSKARIKAMATEIANLRRDVDELKQFVGSFKT